MLQLQYNAALKEQERHQVSGKTRIAERRDGELAIDPYGNTYIDYSQDMRSNGKVLGQDKATYDKYQKLIQEAQIELINARANDKNTTDIENRIKEYKKEAEAIQLTTDELEYLNILEAENESDFQSKLQSGAFDNLDFNGDINKYRELLLSDEDIAEYYDFLMASAGEEAANAYLDAMIGQIANRLPPELKETLEKAIKDSASSAEASSFHHITGNRKESILEEQKFDENQFQQYVQSFKEVGGAGIIDEDVSANHKTIMEENALLEQNIETLTQRKKILEDSNNPITKVLKATGQYDKALQELTKELKSNQSQLDKNNDEIEDMALRCLETNQGLDQLIDG